VVSKTLHVTTCAFLADRTWYIYYYYSVASVVCLSSVQTVLWLNGASYSKSYNWQPRGCIWEID